MSVVDEWRRLDYTYEEPVFMSLVGYMDKNGMIFQSLQWFLQKYSPWSSLHEERKVLAKLKSLAVVI